MSCLNSALCADYDEVKIGDYHCIYGTIHLSSEFDTFIVVSEDWPSFYYAFKGFSLSSVIVCKFSKAKRPWKTSMLGTDLQEKCWESAGELQSILFEETSLNKSCLCIQGSAQFINNISGAISALANCDSNLNCCLIMDATDPCTETPVIEWKNQEVIFREIKHQDCGGVINGSWWKGVIRNGLSITPQAPSPEVSRSLAHILDFTQSGDSILNEDAGKLYSKSDRIQFKDILGGMIKVPCVLLGGDLVVRKLSLK